MEASRCLHQVVSEERRVDAGLASAANGAQLVPAWRRSGVMSWPRLTELPARRPACVAEASQLCRYERMLLDGEVCLVHFVHRRGRLRKAL